MLRLKDLMRTEPADQKAPGEPDEVKYRRHRRRAVEEQPDEALNMQQRLARGRALRKNRVKIALGRKRAMRKMASMDTLKKRSRKAARNSIIKKITKDIPKSELSFARRAEIEKRLDKPAMKAKIDRIAKKLLPKIRKAEQERKRSQSK
jgi:hypothetical protein